MNDGRQKTILDHDNCVLLNAETQLPLELNDPVPGLAVSDIDAPGSYGLVIRVGRKVRNRNWRRVTVMWTKHQVLPTPMGQYPRSMKAYYRASFAESSYWSGFAEEMKTWT